MAVVSALGVAGAPARAEPSLTPTILNGLLNPDGGYVESIAEVFTIANPGTNGAATILFEHAGFAGSNRFGIYDPTLANPLTNLIQLFAGSSAVGAQKSFTLSALFQPMVNNLAVGSAFGSASFGFYLTSPQGTFFSETARNADGFDHFRTFFGTGGSTFAKPPVLYGTIFATTDLIVAAEDLKNGGDRDYNDFGALARNVRAVPEPATLALLGAGLLGLGAMLQRRAG